MKWLAHAGPPRYEAPHARVSAATYPTALFDKAWYSAAICIG
jgi:hypothetical protein